MADNLVFDALIRNGEKVIGFLGGFNKGLTTTKTIATDMVKSDAVARAVLADPKSIKLLQQVQQELKVQESLLAATHKRMREIDNVTVYRQLQKDAADYENRISQLLEEQEHFNALLGKTKQVADSMDGFGGGSFGASPSGALRGLQQSFSGSSGISDAFGAIADTTDMFSDLSQQMEGLAISGKNAMQSVKSIVGTLGEVKAGTKTAGQGFGEIIKGVGEFNVLGALATANVIAWNAVITEFNKKTEEATKSINSLIEARERERARERDITELLESGDIEAATQKFEDAWATQREANAKLADLRQQQADNDRKYAELGSSFNPVERENLYKAGQDLKRQIDEIYAPGGPLQIALEEIDAYNTALPSIEQKHLDIEAAERLKDAESELTDTRLQAKSVAENFAQSLADLEEERNYEDKRLRESRIREDAKAWQGHYANLADIAADGDKRIAEIEADHKKTLIDLEKNFAKAEIEAQKQVAKALADVDKGLAKSIGDSNTSYMREQRRSLEAHLKDMARDEKAYQKERRRRLEQEADDLMNAERANDVVAFIQAQESAAKDLKQMKEDFGDQRSEKQQDFDEQRRLERENHQIELADLRADAADRRAEILQQAAEDKQIRAQQYAEEKQAAIEAYAEQKAQEAAARAQALADARKAFADQRRETAEARRLEDAETEAQRARQLELMLRQFNRELDALNQREAAALTVIQSGGRNQVQQVNSSQLAITNSYRAGAVAAVAAVNAAFKAISTYKPAVSGSSLAAAGYGGGGSGAYTAAKGIVTNKPTMVIMSENHQKEAVIPLEQSPGLPSGMMGGTTLHLLAGATIDLGGISKQEFDEGINVLAQKLVKAVAAAKSGVNQRPA